MFEEFYQLTGNPFRLTPDPHYFFPSRIHKRGLAYLRYGVEQGEGIIVVTGKPGTGKSTLVKTLIMNLDQKKIDIAELNTTQIGPDDLLRLVAATFGTQYEGLSKASLLKGLEALLLKHARMGRRALLIIDEVQNLPIPALEELRMLSNLQFGNQPILQIFLVGQEEFREVLHSSTMDQLLQRVIAAHHLTSLEADETKAYIEHRLRQVDWRGDPAISDEAFRLIHELTGDVPRRINKFCGRLLLHASLEELHEISEHDVWQVQRELKGEADATGMKFVGTETNAEMAEPVVKAKVDQQPLETPEGKVVDAVSTNQEPPQEKAQQKGDSPQVDNVLASRSFSQQKNSAVTNEEIVALTSRPSNAVAKLRIVSAIPQESDELISATKEPVSEAVKAPPEEQEIAAIPQKEEAVSLPQAAPGKEDSLKQPQSVGVATINAVTVKEVLDAVDKQRNRLVMKIFWWVLAVALVVGAVILASQQVPRTVIAQAKDLLLITQLEQAFNHEKEQVAALTLYDDVPVEPVLSVAADNEQLTTLAVAPPTEMAATSLLPVKSAAVTSKAFAPKIEVLINTPANPRQEASKKLAVSLSQSSPIKEKQIAVVKGSEKSEMKQVKELQADLARNVSIISRKVEPTLPATMSAGPEKIVTTIRANYLAENSKTEPVADASVREKELEFLTLNLVAAYEAGDWNLLTELFSNEKMGDTGEDFRDLLKGYAELFQSTELRELTLGEVSWQPLEAGGMHGEIAFKSKQRGNGAIIAVEHSGLITVKVEKLAGKMVITDFNQVFDGLSGH